MIFLYSIIPAEPVLKQVPHKKYVTTTYDGRTTKNHPPIYGRSILFSTVFDSAKDFWCRKRVVRLRHPLWGLRDYRKYFHLILCFISASVRLRNANRFDIASHGNLPKARSEGSNDDRCEESLAAWWPDVGLCSATRAFLEILYLKGVKILTLWDRCFLLICKVNKSNRAYWIRTLCQWKYKNIISMKIQLIKYEIQTVKVVKVMRIQLIYYGYCDKKSFFCCEYIFTTREIKPIHVTEWKRSLLDLKFKAVKVIKFMCI